MSPRDPSALRSVMDAGITGGITLFGATKADGLTAARASVIQEPRNRRPRETRTCEAGGGKAKGEKRKKVMVSVLVAALLAALLTGGPWSGAEAAQPGRGAQVTPSTEQHESKGASMDHQSTPVVRPHPRGLPRAGAPDRRNRRRRPDFPARRFRGFPRNSQDRDGETRWERR